MNPAEQGTNLLFSFIRTIVPNVVAGVLVWASRKTGFIFDENMKATATMYAYGIVFGLYYFGIRLLETYVKPKFSWFLGDFRKGMTAPVYPDPVETTVLPPAQQ